MCHLSPLLDCVCFLRFYISICGAPCVKHLSHGKREGCHPSFTAQSSHLLWPSVKGDDMRRAMQRAMQRQTFMHPRRLRLTAL